MPQEHHLTTPRTARYYTLGEQVRTPAEIWMVCHGYGQLAERFLAQLDALDDGRRLVVAPEGLSRFYLESGSHGPESRVGASWMTSEDRLTEIEDYVRYLDAVFEAACRPVDRSGARLTVLGFSQGTATASRWAMRGKPRVDRLVLWAGLLPPDVEPGAHRRALNAQDLVLVRGDRDELTSGAAFAEQQAALDRAGVRYRLLTFEGGHHLDADVLRRLVAP
jgi:predicted esterase